MDYVRSAYRSKWRLHENSDVLTPGRYYFAPPGTPSAPVGHLLGSRNYTWDEHADEKSLGEWAGKQKWDNGAPPVFLPLAKIVGSEACIADGAAGTDTPDAGRIQFRIVCIGGTVYSVPLLTYASFSIARQDTFFDYYNDVAMLLLDDECEARWEGDTGIPNVKAVLRVTDDGAGGLLTNFYLVDTTPSYPPVTTLCCPSASIAGTLYVKVKIGLYTGATEDWSIEFTNIEMNHHVGDTAWRTEVDDPACDMTIGKIRMNAFCYVPGSTFFVMAVEVYEASATFPVFFWRAFWDYFASVGVFTCSPFHFHYSLLTVSPPYGFSVDGHSATGGQVWKIDFEIQDIPF